MSKFVFVVIKDGNMHRVGTAVYESLDHAKAALSAVADTVANSIKEKLGQAEVENGFRLGVVRVDAVFDVSVKMVPQLEVRPVTQGEDGGKVAPAKGPVPAPKPPAGEPVKAPAPPVKSDNNKDVLPDTLV